MTYVAPNLRDKFESLPIALKNAILEKDVQLNNISDCLYEEIF